MDKNTFNTQVKDVVSQMKSKGSSVEEMQKAVDLMTADFQTASVNAQKAAQPEQDLPWYKDASQFLWKESGLASAASSVMATGAAFGALGQKIVGNDKEAQALLEKSQAMQGEEGFDWASKTNGWLSKESAMSSPMDGFSTGFKLASTFTPLGAEKGMATLAEHSPQLVKFLAKTSPFAVPAALGEGAEGLGKGEDVVTAGGDVLKNYVGNLAGFGLFNAGTKFLKNFGTKMLTSKLVKPASDNMLMVMDSLLSNADDMTPSTLNAIKSNYELAKGQAFNAVTDSLKNPEVESTLWGTLNTKMKSVITEAYEQGANNFKEVFRPDLRIDKKSFEPAMTKIAETLAKENPGMDARTVADSLAKGGIAQTRNLGEKVSGLVNDIQFMLKQNKISPRDVDMLWRTYGIGSADKVENQQIKTILQSMTQSLRGGFESSEDASTRALVGKLDEANAFWQNMSQNLNGEFADLLKTAANPKNFVDSIFTKDPSTIEESISQLLGKLDLNTRNGYSQVFMNELLNKAGSFSTDMTQNGKALESFITKWGNKGLFMPEQVDAIHAVARMMQDDFATFTEKAGEVIGKDLADVVKGAEGKFSEVVNAETRFKVLNDIKKQIGAKTLVSRDASGNFNFDSLKSAMEKLNYDGKYTTLLEGIERYNAVSDAEKPKIAVGLVKVLAGGGLWAAGHPVFGSGSVIGGAKDIWKPGAKATLDEIMNMMKSNPEAIDMTTFDKLLTAFVVGDTKGAETILGRTAQFLGGKAANSLFEKHKDVIPTDEKQIQADIEKGVTPDWFKKLPVKDSQHDSAWEAFKGGVTGK